MDKKESNKQESKTEDSPIVDLELNTKEGEEIKGAVGGGVVDVYFHVIRKR